MKDQSITYTDAPKDYDGFGTETLCVVGVTTTTSTPKEVRKVKTPLRHVDWQRQRYQSGLNFAADHFDFQRMFEIGAIEWMSRCEDPECQGMGIYDEHHDPPPGEGWMHIEMCGECERYRCDDEAAFAHYEEVVITYLGDDACPSYHTWARHPREIANV